MDFKELLKERYAVKHYDNKEKIDDKVLNDILECAVLTPSAVNMQPWEFFLVKTSVGKEKLKACIKDFNIERFCDCYACIVIAAKTALNAQDVMAICKKEEADGRFENKEIFKNRYEHMLKAVDGHNFKGDIKEWCAKQSYIALGTILYASHAYGVDSTPLEGIDADKADEILDLKRQNLHTQCIVLLGKAAKDDSNSLKFRNKSRVNTVKEALFK